MNFILGLALGALASWIITHCYYKLSSRDQERLYKKLSAELREAILDDSREKLSIPDLNRLLNEKTIETKPNEDPLPYKACPKCGSAKLERRQLVDESQDELYYFIWCGECSWSESIP